MTNKEITLCIVFLVPAILSFSLIGLLYYRKEPIASRVLLVVSLLFVVLLIFVTSGGDFDI